MVLTTYLSVTAHNRLKVAAAERQCTMAHLLDEALASYVEHLGWDKPSVSAFRPSAPRVRTYGTHSGKLIKVTTTMSAQSIETLKRLKTEQGRPITQSLEGAVDWYLWKSVSQSRHSIADAFFPLLDLPVKLPVGIPDVVLPDLFQIKQGSTVLMDSSIILLAMDSARLGYLEPRSKQAAYVISEAKNRTMRGLITPFIMAKLWRQLTESYRFKSLQAQASGSFPRSDMTTSDICRRLQAFCSGSIETVPILAEDLGTALAIAKKIPVDQELALSLAAAQRVAGMEFAIASADPSFAPLAESTDFTLYGPTDV